MLGFPLLNFNVLVKWVWLKKLIVVHAFALTHIQIRTAYFNNGFCWMNQIIQYIFVNVSHRANILKATFGIEVQILKDATMR